MPLHLGLIKIIWLHSICWVSDALCTLCPDWLVSAAIFLSFCASFKIQMQTETILLIPKTESPFEMSKVVWIWIWVWILVTGDIGASWLAVCAFHSDSPLPTTECLQVTPSAGSSSSWDWAVYSAATFPAAVWSQAGLKRETTNEVKQAEAKTGRTGFPTSLMLKLTLAC